MAARSRAAAWPPHSVALPGRHSAHRRARSLPAMTLPRAYHTIRKLSREELKHFVADNIKTLAEDEALAVIENPFVTPAILLAIAQSPRLAGFYSARAARRASTNPAGAIGETDPLPLLDRSRAAVGRGDRSRDGAQRDRHATPATPRQADPRRAHRQCAPLQSRAGQSISRRPRSARLRHRPREPARARGRHPRRHRLAPDHARAAADDRRRSEMVVSVCRKEGTRPQPRDAALGSRIAVALPHSQRSQAHPFQSLHIDLFAALHRASRREGFLGASQTN